MNKKARMKVTPKAILTSYKCDLEEQGTIPKTGELQHLDGTTYYTKLKRKRADGIKYLVFVMDAAYRKVALAWTPERMAEAVFSIENNEPLTFEEVA